MLAYVADILVCCFWILAYLFIVIGTIKHQKKIVNPIATLLTSSIEIGFLANVIVPGGEFNYVVLAYIIWVLINGIILTWMHLYFKIIPRKYVIPYILIWISCSFGCYFWCKALNGSLYCTYILTFIALVVMDIDYFLTKERLTPLHLAMFISKFIADFMAIFTYFRCLNWVIDIFCLLLPVVDFITILIYINNLNKYPKQIKSP